jgi:hypothetical protein
LLDLSQASHLRFSMRHPAMPLSGRCSSATGPSARTTPTPR